MPAKAETGPFPAQACCFPAIVDEFDYLKKLVGVDHIALGTDFVTPGSGGGDPAKDFEYPPEMMSKADEIEFVDGFGSVSGLKNLRAEMWQRAAVTPPRRLPRSWAATGCASLGRRGTLNVPLFSASSARVRT